MVLELPMRAVLHSTAVPRCLTWVFLCSMRCFVVQQGGGCPSGKGIDVFVQGGGDAGDCCVQGWDPQHSKDLELTPEEATKML